MDSNLRTLGNIFCNKPLIVKSDSVVSKPCVAISLVDHLNKTCVVESSCVDVDGVSKVSEDTLWHFRLGHVPVSKLK